MEVTYIISENISNSFTDGFLIQPNSDGSAPSTGTLSGANKNIGIGYEDDGLSGSNQFILLFLKYSA